MKSRRMVVFVIVIILLIILTVFKYNQEQKKYKEYANEKLNKNFYEVCDYMVDANATIENAIEKEYIFEKDLEYLNSRFFAYLRSLDEVNDISRKFNEFNFFVTNIRDEFNWEYSNFYHRIDDLFGEREYDDNSGGKHQLSQSDLKIFKQSYDYTSKVIDIIRKHIDYYNMFDIVMIEIEETGRVQQMKRYKEEYLEPWPDNKFGTGVIKLINDDGTITEIPREEFRYDYPKQPFIKVNDREWIDIYKEIYLLNIDTAK